MVPITGVVSRNITSRQQGSLHLGRRIASGVEKLMNKFDKFSENGLVIFPCKIGELDRIIFPC